MINTNFIPAYNAHQQVMIDKTGTTLSVPYGNGGWQLKNMVVVFDGENYNVTADSNMYKNEGSFIYVSGYTNADDDAFRITMYYDDETGKFVMSDDPKDNTFYDEYITEDGGTFRAEYDDGESNVYECNGSWTYAEASSNRDNNEAL